MCFRRTRIDSDAFYIQSGVIYYPDVFDASMTLYLSSEKR